MAPDSKVKKRKVADPEEALETVKKTKKTSTAASEEASASKKRKVSIEDAAQIPSTKTSKQTKQPAPKSKGKDKKAKKAPAAIEESEDDEESEDPPQDNDFEAFDSSASDKEPDAASSSENDDAEDIADQTAALLTGFESESVSESGEEQPNEPTQSLPPLSKKAQKKARALSVAAAAKKAAQAQDAEDEETGVIVISRIPHGFYEHEIRSYLEQFGEVLKVRLSRNRKTGASKHYAFVEFASREVASIVQQTMNNYLLWGHLLKVQLLAKENEHPDLFKDKSGTRRFKKVPWGKIEGRKLAQGMGEEGWKKRIEREEKRRTAKAEKLKALGMDYEFVAPKVKGVEDVQQQDPLLIGDGDQGVKAVESAK